MGLKLTWSDDNIGEDGFNIYRDTSPMDPQNLPVALGSVGSDVYEFIDTTVVEGNTYYYRVSAVMGAIESVSEEYSVLVTAVVLPTTNLFARWRGNDSTTSLFTDLVGSNNFTAYNSPSIVAGNLNNAIEFNGTNQYARTSIGSNMLTGSFTILIYGMVPGTPVGSEPQRVGFAQGKDGSGSGWSINLGAEATSMNCNVVTASPVAGKGCTYTFPTSVADEYHVFWFRYTSGVGVECGIDDNTVRASQYWTNTGLRTSSYGFFFGDLQAASSNTYYRGIHEDMLVYNAAISNADLADAIQYLSLGLQT